MRLRKFMFRMLLGFAMLLVIGAMADGVAAQVNTVNMSGTVLDPQGLAVKNAALTMANLANGAVRTATSGENGRYEIIGLPPGNYSLTVEAQGFAESKVSPLTLTLGASGEYNPQLQLKSSSATVSVTATPDLVETSKTDVSTTITGLQITICPSMDGTTSISRF
jgi:ABC-type Na+ efflux pump permease subunit